MSIVANEELSLGLLLFAILCSAVVCCITTTSLLKNDVGSTRTGKLTCALFGAALILVSVDYLGLLDRWFMGTAKSLVQLGCLAVLGSAIWAIANTSQHWRQETYSRRKLSVWMMLATSLTICFLCTHRMQASTNDDLSLLTWPAVPGKTKLVESHFGVTDKGNHIDLYTFELAGELPTDDEALQASSNSFPVALIRRKQVDLNANCHGWVFAKGLFLINSSGVNTILEDNDYTRIDRPQAGDIAIYRNSSGDPIHTALVCSVLSDNTILLESKWGLHQRFIHLPEDQPYSTLIEYYRTPRTNHSIMIIEREASTNHELQSNMGG